MASKSTTGKMELTDEMILAEMTKRSLEVGTKWESYQMNSIREGVTRVLSHGRDYFQRHTCYGKSMMAAIDSLAFPTTQH